MNAAWLGLLGSIPLVLATTALHQAPDPTPSPAAESPVAYVSTQRILTEWTQGKSQVARLQAEQRERAVRVLKAQQALASTRQRLATTTDPTERAQVESIQRDQQAAVERETAAMQVDIQSLQRDLQASLQAKVRPVIADLVKNTGTKVVLNSDSAVVWAAPGLDLTSPVVERLNREQPERKP